MLNFVCFGLTIRGQRNRGEGRKWATWDWKSLGGSVKRLCGLSVGILLFHVPVGRFLVALLAVS